MTGVCFTYMGDKEKMARLTTIRAGVERILSSTIHPHFTDHSVHHSDRMVELLGALIEPMQATQSALNDRELFVLYAGCYLHDVGMQCSNCSGYRTVQERGWARDWESVCQEDRLKRIRAIHAELSAEMVRRSATEHPPPINTALDERDYFPAIANLCLSHVLSVASDTYLSAVEPGARLDMRLLSALLRIADILDASAARSWLEKERLMLMPSLSRVHWWKHYYVEDVEIESTQHRIMVTFAFPPGEKDEYREIVPELVIPDIRDELARHRSVLLPRGADYEVSHRVLDDSLSAKDKMPPEVKDEALVQLSTMAQETAASVNDVSQEVIWEVHERLAARAAQLSGLSDDFGKVAGFSEHQGLASRLELAGYRREAYSLLGAAIAAARDAGDHRSLSELRMRAGELASQFGWGILCRSHAMQAAEDGQAAGLVDPVRTGQVHLLVAKGHAMEYEIGEAHAAFDRAASHFTGAKRSDLAAEAILERTRLHIMALDWDNARQSLRRLRQLPEVARKHGQEMVLYDAIICTGAGSLADATNRCSQLEADNAAGELTIRALIWRAYSHYLADNAEAADKDLATAQELAASHGIYRWVSTIKADLAALSTSQLDANVNARLASAWDLRTVADEQMADDDMERLNAYEDLNSQNVRQAVVHAWKAWGHAALSCDWLSVRSCAKVLSRCLLPAGLPLPALKYSLQFAQDVQLARSATELISRSGNRELIDSAADYVLAAGKTPLLQATALNAFEALVDVVSDQKLDAALHFALESIIPEMEGWHTRDVCMASLKLCRMLAQRLNKKQCSHVASCLLEHSLEDWPELLAEHSFRILEHTIYHGTDGVVRKGLAAIQKSLESRPELRRSSRFASLLSVAGQAKSGKFREQCRRLLSPDGKLHGTDMIQAGCILGMDLNKRASLEDLTRRAMTNMNALAQVKVIGDRSPDDPVYGELAKFEHVDKVRGVKVRVSLSNLPLLACVTALKDVLSTDQVDRIAQTVISVCRNRDIGQSNRVAMLQLFAKLCSRVSGQTAANVAAFYLEAIDDRLPLSSLDEAAHNSQHPLARGRINIGHPEDLLCVALQGLGSLAARHRRLKRELFEAAYRVLVSRQTKAPAFAFDALVIFGDPPSRFDPLAIECLHHQSPEVVEGAVSYFTCIDIGRVEKQEEQRLVGYLCSIADDPDPRRRSAAARLCRHLLTARGTCAYSRETCETHLRALRKDISWQVRQQLFGWTPRRRRQKQTQTARRASARRTPRKGPKKADAGRALR